MKYRHFGGPPLPLTQQRAYLGVDHYQYVSLSLSSRPRSESEARPSLYVNHTETDGLSGSRSRFQKTIVTITLFRRAKILHLCSFLLIYLICMIYHFAIMSYSFSKSVNLCIYHSFFIFNSLDYQIVFPLQCLTSYNLNINTKN